MKEHQRKFIELALQHKNMLFGEFTLKSGRISPYFFNAGLFDTSATLAKLGRLYADAIMDHGVEFDMLFGPAYKAIPFMAATATSLYNDYQKDIGFCYNRKEAKPYGEGGQFIGAPLKGRVLIVDDILSAGVTARECVAVIRGAGAIPAGLVVAFDRQECGEVSRLSAMQELAKEFDMPAFSIGNLSHLLEVLRERPDMAQVLGRIEQYYETYGVYSQG